MKKKVCFFLYNLDPGGLEVYLLRFINFMDDKVEATVICKSGKTGQLLNDYNASNIKIIPVKAGYFNFSGWFKIYKVLNADKFDSVCDLTSNFGGIYMFLGWLAGIRKRVAYYGQSTNHFKETRLNLLYNGFVNMLVRKFATAIVFNSQTACNFFFGSKNDLRFKIIFNGVDSTQFLPEPDFSYRKELNIPENAFVIGHTGRLDEKKNHQTVLKLAKKLVPLKSDIFVVMCGKETNKLEKDIRELGLGNRVFALGYRKDVNLFLRNINIFYFPSYTEGQPNSLIEALMTGLPFVASDIQPNKDTIPAGFEKQLVNADDFETASGIIMQVYNNRSLAANMSCRAWAIKTFDARLRFNEFYDCL
jgi:glycosyltransferase involved in cell wall biosynthesis